MRALLPWPPPSAPALAGLALIGMLATLPACTVTDDESASTAAAPEVQALYGSLQPATPDRLRGVWSIKTGNNDGEADLRMRFEDGKLTVGTRCVAKADPNNPVLVGKSTAMSSTDLDGKAGVFDLAETVDVTEKKNGITCTGRFDKATWKFVITGSALEMDPVGLQGHVRLDKVGD